MSLFGSPLFMKMREALGSAVAYHRFGWASLLAVPCLGSEAASKLLKAAPSCRNQSARGA
jgi:hypothetical protein